MIFWTLGSGEVIVSGWTSSILLLEFSDSLFTSVFNIEII
jgi:hypothetical protein